MRLTIELDIPYEDESPTINHQIRTWVRDTLESECSFVPFYIEEHGDIIECATGPVTIKKLI